MFLIPDGARDVRTLASLAVVVAFRRQRGLNWAFIADPGFYVVAVPAVLLMGLSKSGFLGGFGALATPLLCAGRAGAAGGGHHAAAAARDGRTAAAAALARPRPRAAAPAAARRAARHRARDTCSSACCRRRRWPAWWARLTLLFLAQRLLFPPRPTRRRRSRTLGFGCLASRRASPASSPMPAARRSTPTCCRCGCRRPPMPRRWPCSSRR